MRYDLIINGSVTIENVESDQTYSDANELLKAEYLPLVGSPRGGISGLGKEAGRAILVAWDRVTTLEARIRQ